jgi:hypothetical protein
MKMRLLVVKDDAPKFHIRALSYTKAGLTLLFRFLSSTSFILNGLLEADLSFGQLKLFQATIQEELVDKGT